MEQNSIEAIHRTKTGKVSDKWASYLPFYDGLFKRIRHEPVSLLEIGVQNGGSIQTWCQYFENASLLVGCDINPACAKLNYQDSRVRIVIGNANERSTIQTISGLSRAFDVIIDDGSHRSMDILTSFLLYFPMVKPSGLYVIEDTHTLYWNAWGGGILNDRSAYAFFKRMVDVINYQFWRQDLSLDLYLNSYFPKGKVPPFITEGWIESIEFRNSMIVISKAAAPGHEKLGERLIRGDVATVAPPNTGPSPSSSNSSID